MGNSEHGAGGLPHPHPAALDPDRLMEHCDLQRCRASGPGGQHRNKVQTAVRIRHRPTGTEGLGQERRSQAQNLNVAIHRLRVNLAVSVRCAIDQDYRPSALWRSRCSRGRVAVNCGHRDFPAVLCEAMDVLAAMGPEVGPAARALGCTASQLVKLLRAQPRALQWLNEWRRQAGLDSLC